MVTSRKYNIQEQLRKWLSGAERVVIAGIGNPIRMDDFVGGKIVQDLQGKVSDKVMLIECETVPEGYMQQIIDFKPTHVLLIDAAILGLKPGKTRFIGPEELRDSPAFLTHLLPLRLFCEYVGKETGAKIRLLLVEPEKTDFGEGLTPEVSASAQNIAKVLFGLFD